MIRRLLLALLITAALLIGLLPRSSAVAPTPWIATPGADFSPLPTPRPAASPTSTVPRDLSGLRAATSGPPLTRRPATAVPSRAATTPRSAIAGIASFYGTGPAGVAAAGPALRAALGPNWRGSTVRVCTATACVSLVLGDWCACVVGSSERLIDLPRDAFRLLADPARGLVKVEVVR